MKTTVIKYYVEQRLAFDCHVTSNDKVLSHYCLAEMAPDLFLTPPSQNLSCQVGKDEIFCHVRGEGVPKTQNYVLYKRSINQLAISGVTESLKAFVGVVLYAGSNAYRLENLDPLRKDINKFLSVHQKDVYEEMSDQLKMKRSPILVNW